MGRILLLIPVLAVVLAVPAHADPDGDYLAYIGGQPGMIGGPVNNGLYLASGHHACDLMASGVTPDDAAGQLTNFFVTPYIAKTMVTGAKRTLCP
jgi:hypothetical protein